MADVLDREEQIEQAYFFRTMRERIEEKMPTQEIMERIHEEILATTRLPMAIQFLATELKHTGLLSSGFARLQHYFTPFQAFVICQTENERTRFSLEIGLSILEREAEYRAGAPTQPGLFVYQFEAISRNRLGYDAGLGSVAGDSFYDADWKVYVDLVRRQIGVVDFADLVYARSELYVTEQRRRHSAYEPPLTPLFGEKEGKIARASRGRDPLFLFAALQRQLGYPEVPRARSRDDPLTQLEALKAKLKEVEIRLKLVEGEARGRVDLSEFMNRPELLERNDDEDS
jgi:hypothetical protein